ncbi:MAG: hypothetical protein ACRC7N_13610 [Clostridium sp.]
MNELNDILGLDLNTIEVTEINEEHLIALKNSNHYTQTNFYFWLYERSLEQLDNNTRAYVTFLMSYYIFIIYTPLNYESIAFTLAKKAIHLHRSTKYLEWLLIFSSLPQNLITTFDTINLAEEILELNPESITARTILELY